MTDSRDFAALADRVLPGARILGVRRLTGGVSADVHALVLAAPDGAQQTVVVRQRPAAAWKPGHRELVVREHALLMALFRAGLPVPEPMLLDTAGELLAHAGMVMAYVEGTSEVAAETLDATLDTMADMLLRIHGLSTARLPELPSRSDPLPELVQYLPDAPEWRALREQLEGVGDAAYRGVPVLLHGDYWPENLLWREGRLVGILDWEDAALGDPLSDVAGARLELLWRYGPQAADRFTRAYARQREIDPRRLAPWDMHVGAGAAHFMGDWGLEPEREARMRRQAYGFIREAARGV